MKLNTRQILEAFVETRFERADDREMTARNIEIFFLRTFKEITLREIGEEFGLSVERVRGINAKMSRQFRFFVEKRKMEI